MRPSSSLPGMRTPRSQMRFWRSSSAFILAAACTLWRTHFCVLRSHSCERFGVGTLENTSASRFGRNGSQSDGEAKLAKVANVTFTTAFQSLRVQQSWFDIGHLVVQDFPDHP